MSDNMTGPELFQNVQRELLNAFAHDGDSARERENALLGLEFAKVGAIQANTAALVMIAGLIANSADQFDANLAGWAEIIPAVPLKECQAMDIRRPQCADRHTEDCAYADPPPEPKHKLLPIGTRVLVSERRMEDEDYPPQPWVGKVKGYDMGRTKYEIYPEIGRGQYSSASRWAFTDNRVQPHPDGPECSPEESMGLR